MLIGYKKVAAIVLLLIGIGLAGLVANSNYPDGKEGYTVSVSFTDSNGTNINSFAANSTALPVNVTVRMWFDEAGVMGEQSLKQVYIKIYQYDMHPIDHTTHWNLWKQINGTFDEHGTGGNPGGYNPVFVGARIPLSYDSMTVGQSTAYMIVVCNYWQKLATQPMTLFEVEEYVFYTQLSSTTAYNSLSMPTVQ